MSRTRIIGIRPVLQSSAVHPSPHRLHRLPPQRSLHVHVFGAVQIPLTHGKRQIADIQHKKQEFISPTSHLAPRHPALHVQLLLPAQTPYPHPPSHIAAIRNDHKPKTSRVRQSFPPQPSQHRFSQMRRENPSMSGHGSTPTTAYPVGQSLRRMPSASVHDDVTLRYTQTPRPRF